MALAKKPRARRSARVDRPLILAAIAAGARVEDVARDMNLTTKRVEQFLIEELRRRWIAPAQDHARLQIVRLEAIAAKLKLKAEKGDLPTIDRLLRVLDRLDRYHGYSRMTSAAGAAESEDVRNTLLAKLNQAARVLPGDCA